jgi:hypothetical protein
MRVPSKQYLKDRLEYLEAIVKDLTETCHSRQETVELQTRMNHMIAESCIRLRDERDKYKAALMGTPAKE